MSEYIELAPPDHNYLTVRERLSDCEISDSETKRYDSEPSVLPEPLKVQHKEPAEQSPRCSFDMTNWEAPPGASETPFRVGTSRYQYSLLGSQTLLLILGAIYIYWWPDYMDIAYVEKAVQNWQIIYLTVSLTSTYYGTKFEDRGWLMVSMFMHIGIMNLFPFWSFTWNSLFELTLTILAICSVFTCYSLSESIQEKQFSVVRKNVNENQNLEQKRRTVLMRLETNSCHPVEPEAKLDLDLPTTLYVMNTGFMKANIDEESKKSFKRQLLCFDLPDLNIYKMGNLQAGISVTMIFAGILWYMLHEAISTEPRDFDHTELDAQKQYVQAIMIRMIIAGIIGLLGGISQRRTLLILALAFTIVPFVCIIQNGVKVAGSKQGKYQNINIFLMGFCSWVSLAHLWVCLRFSEKLQLWWEAKFNKVDNSIGKTCNFLCLKPNLMRLYFYALVISAIILLASGVALMFYWEQAAKSKQKSDSPEHPEFIHAYCSFCAIISAGCVFYFVYSQSRVFYCFTFCLLAETLTRSYTLYQLASHARELLLLSNICINTCDLAIFFGMLACEAIQDYERMLNDNSEAKMRKALPLEL